jgi:hypothetical protein
MNLVVYGRCIEPGGLALEDQHRLECCPRCGLIVRTWPIARDEGGLNVHTEITCNVTDTQGDCPDDMPSLMPREYCGLPAENDEDDFAEDP